MDFSGGHDFLLLLAHLFADEDGPCGEGRPRRRRQGQFLQLLAVQNVEALVTSSALLFREHLLLLRRRLGFGLRRLLLRDLLLRRLHLLRRGLAFCGCPGGALDGALYRSRGLADGLLGSARLPRCRSVALPCGEGEGAKGEVGIVLLERDRADRQTRWTRQSQQVGADLAAEHGERGWPPGQLVDESCVVAQSKKSSGQGEWVSGGGAERRGCWRAAVFGFGIGVACGWDTKARRGGGSASASSRSDHSCVERALRPQTCST